ncbi:energy-coupling factor transporter transmembrane component T family protein [Lapidilactobacillus wuchangensis]|uniref:energy-coupling factor transporter transmembrane component T family protein n=1 Tax=Lapidilactobacillus wuchangensis TaxID=2486001 RepID=UPI000F78A921|nr:energy-coupling factor transporter transmembrane protein EcfT [Lapidilactobacillus wuchangensis]
MNKLIFGRYYPGDSFVHRLDPRLKLILNILFIVLIFFAQHWPSYVILGAVVVVSVWASGISLGFFLRGLRPMLWLILFTVGLQLFFTSGQHVYWQWGWLSISREGLINAGYIAARFLLIIFMSTLLTLTTQPLEIADGLEYLISPLRVIKFPVNEVALMLSIALRFVPKLMDETTKIMNAQRARGVDFNNGSLLKRAKALLPLLIPLMMSSIDIASDLTTAMISRGYRDGEGRTRYRILKWQSRDSWVLAAFAVISTGMLVLERMM